MNNFPTEIWAEVVDHVLHDKILFIHDLTASNLPFRTAFLEWKSLARARRLERQRGVLRLVSSTWKDLAEKSRYQYFHPILLDTSVPHRDRLCRARRVFLNDYCPSCGCCCGWTCYCLDCVDCESDVFPELKVAQNIALISLAGKTIAAEILEVSSKEMNQLLYNKFEGAPISTTLLPHLQTLSIRNPFHNIPLLARHHSNLVSLELSIDLKEFYTGSVSFPTLSFFKIVFVEDFTFGREDLCSPLENWSLPSLRHLEVIWNPSSGERFMFYILAPADTEQRSKPNGDVINGSIEIPEKTWPLMQSLVYLEAASLGDTWREFVVESGGQHADILTSGFRSEPLPPLRRSLGTAQLSQTCGSHTWENMPVDFEKYDPTDAQDHASHCDESWECWKCVAAFHDWCSSNGIRCKDRKGRNFEEVRGRPRS